MSELPEPLVAPDADLKDFPFTPIYRARLFGSAFHARATDSEWRAGVTLWLKAQDQVPAGSLPDDDIELCRLAELGRDLKTWRKLRTGALHGWFKCDDGRLYNTVVAEVVNEQWSSKIERQKERAEWRDKKRRQREGQTGEITGTSPEMSSGTAATVPGDVPGENALKGQGERQGQGEKERKEEKSARGARLPADWTLPPEWRAAAEQARREAKLPPCNLDLEAASFRDYWVAKPGKDGVKLDWRATWLNWARRANSRPTQASLPINGMPMPSRTWEGYAPGTPKSRNIVSGSIEDIDEREELGLLTKAEADDERAKIRARETRR